MVDGNSNAFPIDTPYVSYNGLTKREYFAALAMQSYVGMNPKSKVVGAQWETAIREWTTDQLAAFAVAAADSLIKKLNENEINSIK